MRTIQVSRWGLKSVLFAAFALLVLGQVILAAPFSKQISFKQPDGTQIRIFGEGDEFYAVFETLDGYSVTFDEALQGYCYAELSADGSQLLSTGVLVGSPVARPANLVPHLRINEQAIAKQAGERFARWDAAMQVSRRWREVKAAAAAPGDRLDAPPSTTTTGLKTGLTLLIDFDDDPATVPQAEIVQFCNADNYTGFGNACSVKKYFQDMSNGKLTYDNVVTIYIRAPRPKTVYNDINRDAGDQANTLIKEVLDTMKALTNYTTDILPTFNSVTVNAQKEVVAFNVFYSGDNGGRWTYGLWPHSWGLYNVGPQELSPGGKRVFRYQITNIGTELSIGTFCHENGHMLCGYPDLYDYTYRSAGSGNYCLMAYGGSDKNPVQIGAYLKRASGWATTIELNSTMSMNLICGASGTNYNVFYRYAKPTAATEYYLIENRNKVNHDASLPSSGILVWHIDELGDNSTVNLNPNSGHNNFEATVVQADNLWDLERGKNAGNANDLYFQGNPATGYKNELTDTSRPHSHWWDGSNSGLALRAFTPAGATMSFYIGVVTPVILTHPTNVVAVTGQSVVFAVKASGAQPLSYQWRKGNNNLPTGIMPTFTLNNVQMNDAGTYSVLVFNAFGTATSSNVVLSVAPRIPVITSQPADVAALIGTPAKFSVTAIGGPPLSYQWFFNGGEIPAATGMEYVVTGTDAANAGAYSVKVTNPYGSVTSANAVLTPLMLASMGDNSFGQFNVAAGSTNIATVAAGGWHNLALRIDGKVTAWGFNWEGQCDVPAQAVDVLGIAGGGYHSLALLANGKVLAWGGNDSGQASPPANVANVRAVAAGTWHSLALRNNGTVVAWGDNSWGQSDVPAGLVNVVAIAAGGNHSLALKADGTVVAWGQNFDAQGIYVGQSSVPWGLKNVRAIAAGEYHSGAVTSDGRVVLWGDNSSGQCQAPEGLSGVIGLTAGLAHTVALKGDGTSAAWGNNDRGQSSFPNALKNVVAVSAGQYHTVVLVGDPKAGPLAFRPSWSAGQFKVVLPTAPGKNYALEYRDSPIAGSWSALPAVQGTGGLQVLTDPAANGPQRSYRVKQW
jgi:M6 family metalloprotease-like protein